MNDHKIHRYAGSLAQEITTTFLPDSHELRLESLTPVGEPMFFCEYDKTQSSWEYLGKTPMDEVKLIWAQYTLKFIKDGYEPVEITSEHIPDSGTQSIILDPVGSLPKNMAHVPPGSVSVAGLAPMHLDDFLIDK